MQKGLNELFTLSLLKEARGRDDFWSKLSYDTYMKKYEDEEEYEDDLIGAMSNKGSRMYAFVGIFSFVVVFGILIAITFFALKN